MRALIETVETLDGCAAIQAQGVSVMRVPAGRVTRAIEDVVDGVVRAATARIAADAPSTALRAVPLPRSAGEDGASRRRGGGDSAPTNKSRRPQLASERDFDKFYRSSQT